MSTVIRNKNPITMTMKKTTPTYIIIKLLEISDKEKNRKSSSLRADPHC